MDERNLPSPSNLLDCAAHAISILEKSEADEGDRLAAANLLRRATARAKAKIPELILEPGPRFDPDGAERRLDELQHLLHVHDHVYQPGLIRLEPVERVKQFCFHIMSRIGTFTSTEPGEIMFRRALTNLFLISLSSANAIGLRLSSGMPVALTLKEASYRIANRRLKGDDIKAALILGVANANGRLADAVERVSRTRNEIDRQSMKEAVQSLAELTLAAGYRLGMNLDEAALAQLRLIEELEVR